MVVQSVNVQQLLVDEPLQSCLENQGLLPARDTNFFESPRHAEPAISLSGTHESSMRAAASQRSTMSLRRVSMMSISSLCSAAGTLYLSRASARWPTTMSNSALVIPSPACVVFAERLITLHGPPVTLHTRFLVFCLNVSRVSVPIPTKYLPTVGSTNSRSSKSSTTAEMPL